jgi:hypothetical protein
LSIRPLCFRIIVLLYTADMPSFNLAPDLSSICKIPPKLFTQNLLDFYIYVLAINFFVKPLFELLKLRLYLA